MITIVITYFNRQMQLTRTLESFKKYDPKEFNVIIVDDGSPEDIVLTEYPFKITVIKMVNKTWTQGDPAYNTGFKYALNSEIIIIQNAESYHAGDILAYAKKVTDENYISFGCYSLAQWESPLIRNHGLLCSPRVLNSKGASFDGDSAWYNHPVHRPSGYHFCSAITTKNLIKLNGFDERFAFGIGYDDDYFLHQIRSLGLKIEITESPMVFHQWHDHSHYSDSDLINKNKELFVTLTKENNYKAHHLVIPDL